MQKIPIIGQGKEGAEIQSIRSGDIVKIERLSHHEYIVHTQNDALILNFSLETLEEWLYEEGFRLIDRNNLVNIHHIAGYDLLKGKVFFGDPQNTETKTATVARSQYKHLEALLHLLKTNPELVQNEAASAVLDDVKPEDNPTEFERSYQTFLDVAERQRTESRIKQMAYHDALTGLPNRLMLRERMIEAIQQTQQSKKQTAVFFIDLDRFKVINDTLGHHVGDLLLMNWASRFDQLIASIGMVARFSGDEFIILLPEVENLEFVQQTANDVIKLFHTPFVHSHHELYSTASIGISLYPKDGEDPDTIRSIKDSGLSRVLID